MDNNLIVGLINNAVLLFAMGLVYDVMIFKYWVENNLYRSLSGIVIGLIGVLVMLTPWEYKPGLIFDTRSVVLSIGALFFGTIPALISVIMTATLRIYQGGIGMYMGLGVIGSSALIGVVIRQLKLRNRQYRNLTNITAMELFGFGVLVHVVMILWMLILPKPEAYHVITQISLPVMLIYPVSTLVLGLFLLSRNERIAAERKIASSENKYRGLFEQAPETIVLLGLDGIIIDLNHAKNIFGMPRKDLIGKHFSEISLLGQHVDKFDKVLQGTLGPFTIKTISKSKQPTWFEVNQAHVVEEGEICIRITLVDITLNRIKDQELITLSQAVNQSPASIVVTDTKGNIEYVNPKFEELTGYTAEEVLGKNPRILKSGEQGKEFYRDLWETIGAGKTWSGEFRNKKKNGETYWEAARISPILDEAGETIQYMAVKENITERKIAEEALKKNEVIFQIITKNATDFIWTIDMDFNMTYASDSAQRILGYTPEEIMKLNAAELFTSAEFERIQSLLLSELEIGAPHPGIKFQSKNLRKDKTEFDVEIQATIIYDHKKEPQIIQGYTRDISERLYAEKLLRQSEEQYRMIVENANDGIEISQDDKIFYSNNRFAEMLGYSVDEIKKISFKKIFTKEGLLELEERAKERHKTESRSGSYEATFVRKDGLHIQVDVKYEIIDYMGKPATFAIIRDISERIKAERELQRYSERQEQLLQTAYGLASSLDIDVVLEKVGHEIQSLLKCEGVTVYFLDDPGDLLIPAVSLEPEHSKKIMETRVKVDHSLSGQVVKANKGMIFNQASQQPGAYHIPGTPVEDDDNLLIVPLVAQNKVIGVISLLRRSDPFTNDELNYASTIAIYVSAAINNARTHDILKREIRSREASEEMSHDLGRIIEDSLNEIYLFDAETLQFVFINKGAKENIGYSLEEIKELTPLDIKPLHDETSFRQLLKPLMAGEIDNLHFETIHRRKDNSLYPVSVSLQMSSYMGKLTFLAIISDITDQRIQEEKQLELEAQLRQSQKLEAVGTMAGGIAHDFNNILQGLYLYAGIIKKELPDNERMRSNFQHIIDAGDRARDLVKQILTFSRREEAVLKPTKIQFLIKNALKLTRASTPSTIEIRDNIDSNCGPILCDSTQIHQIFINLCNNAIHAMRETGGTLTVSYKEVDAKIEVEPGAINSEASGVAELCVSDTGHGMADEVMEKIFDPFFTTKDTNEGTGLGLSIVHGIIKEMKGQILVESELTKGSTFRILLPLTEDEIVPEVVQEHSITIPEGMRILFVEDDQMIASAGKFILENKGYSVDLARDGQVAVEMFLKDPDGYNLIVTDLTMPRMTGLALTKEIRGYSKNVPIVLTSGNLDQALQSEFETYGVNGFIRKPWTADEMLKAIDAVFSD
ncbi:MAG: PAS domain S-box protein [Candidatus Marinimicrobia bacterium]|nr:PAS domain S-box protein [Candidatus Neomarinimicrobiota bacterium]